MMSSHIIISQAEKPQATTTLIDLTKDTRLDPPRQEVVIVSRHQQMREERVEKPMRKPKFSTKVKEMMPQNESLDQTYVSKKRESFEPLPGNNRREKNTFAAKSCRQRKKVYLKLLEESINNLESSLFCLDEQIESINSQIFNALMHTQQINKKNGDLQSLLLKKLKNLVNREGPSEDPMLDHEINICLDSCIYRIGSSGSQRRAILDILYKGMINRNLPNIYRYIQWCAVNRRQMFGSGRAEENQAWWNEIKEMHQFVKSNEVYLQERRPPIAAKGQQIYVCAQRILEKKKEIEAFGSSYDSLIEDLRKSMTATQFAQLFLFAERNLHKSELDLTGESLECQSGVQGRKRVKQAAVIKEESLHQ